MKFKSGQNALLLALNGQVTCTAKILSYNETTKLYTVSYNLGNKMETQEVPEERLKLLTDINPS